MAALWDFVFGQLIEFVSEAVDLAVEVGARSHAVSFGKPCASASGS